MKKWITLPAAEYTPDMPDYQNPGSGNIRNCLPRTPESYGPFPSLAPFGGALTAQCQGAVSVTDSGGNVYVFAGDVNNLYEYTSGSTTPSVVSNGTNPYTADVEGNWNFDLMGQRVVATDYEDAIQSFILGSSTKFADLANGGITALTIAVQGSTYTNGTNYALAVSGGGGSGFTGLIDVVSGHFTNARITNLGHGFTSVPTVTLPAGAGAGDGTASVTATIASIAPKAKYVAVVKNFLMVAFTNDAVSGVQPQRVWWPALNDPTNWPTPGTAAAAEFQSSFNDLFGNFGPITGLVGSLGTADCAIFFQRAIWRGVYAGPPVVFDFFPCETVKGTSAPNSIVKRGLLVDYLGEDGFYTFDGTNSTPIGLNKVDKTFLADLDQSHLNNVIGAADPVNRLTLWAYPGKGNVNGIPNRILAFSWAQNRFAIIDMPAGVEYIFRSLSFGNTLDNMPGGTLDQIKFALDSSVWTGGVITLSAFDANHKLSYFNGANLAPTIETSEQAPFDPMLCHISDVRPLVDGGTPSVSLATRNRLIDNFAFNSPTAINGMGTCPQLANGRYVRAQTTLMLVAVGEGAILAAPRVPVR
jgi:hypothetical protein